MDLADPSGAWILQHLPSFSSMFVYFHNTVGSRQHLLQNYVPITPTLMTSLVGIFSTFIDRDDDRRAAKDRLPTEKALATPVATRATHTRESLFIIIHNCNRFSEIVPPCRRTRTRPSCHGASWSGPKIGHKASKSNYETPQLEDDVPVFIG